MDGIGGGVRDAAVVDRLATVSGQRGGSYRRFGVSLDGFDRHSLVGASGRYGASGLYDASGEYGVTAAFAGAVEAAGGA
ncbi:hypothetical protein G9272_16225 [Streptomyces asoensis]|uniref:Uncharacterized protein n=1 Tax=Streptomyces asoensis TaxID=249586 RepID=A0A6M4WQS1_9ACTN|nr:hypothetical protein [Streptomyces asoensis]QJT01665.1 hypothetical protein G9272_16225 [Streptomyces asoensis]